MARSILLRSTPEASSEDVVDDYDVTCYIVNEEEMIADGEDPHVICTGEPEEVGSFQYCMILDLTPCNSQQIMMFLLCCYLQYAWFNGIDPKMMVETDETLEGSVECKEGESYKGKPEWECE